MYTIYNNKIKLNINWIIIKEDNIHLDYIILNIS